jgi:hypothetical protein
LRGFLPTRTPPAAHDKLPRSASRLLDYPLLNPYDDWQRWFARAGVAARVPLAGKTFDDPTLLLQAADLISVKRDGIVTPRLHMKREYSAAQAQAT